MPTPCGGHRNSRYSGSTRGDGRTCGHGHPLDRGHRLPCPVADGDALTLQITGSAVNSSGVNYENFATPDVIDVSDIVLDMPLRMIVGRVNP